MTENPNSETIKEHQELLAEMIMRSFVEAVVDGSPIRVSQINSLNEQAEETKVNPLDFYPIELMKNEHISGKLLKLFKGRHGHDDSFSEEILTLTKESDSSEDQAYIRFIIKDLQETWKLVRADGPVFDL